MNVYETETVVFPTNTDLLGKNGWKKFLGFPDLSKSLWMVLCLCTHVGYLN